MDNKNNKKHPTTSIICQSSSPHLLIITLACLPRAHEHLKSENTAKRSMDDMMAKSIPQTRGSADLDIQQIQHFVRHIDERGRMLYGYITHPIYLRLATAAAEESSIRCRRVHRFNYNRSRTTYYILF